MNVEELVAQFRVDADDELAPFLWTEQAVITWLNEAEEEAVLRGRLLFDAVTPAICQLPATADRATYPLHKLLYEIAHLRFKFNGDIRSEPVHLITRNELDRIRPDWRNETDDQPIRYAIQDEKTLQLVPTPRRPGVLHIEGYRFPLKPLTDGAQTPEINTSHHRLLVHWALHRAFSKPDAETFDQVRADRSEKDFTRYFGQRPDSGQRRETQYDRPQHNRAW